MSQESTFAGDDDDVEGHRQIKTRADAESAEGDDVEGHIYVQTPAGPKA